MNDEIIVFGMFLVGTAVVLLGAFMWQGGWAALAAVGLLTVILAMSQSTVMATSDGAKSIRKEIVRTACLGRTNAAPAGARIPPVNGEKGLSPLRSVPRAEVKSQSMRNPGDPVRRTG
jgi:hypothetical protein